MQVTGGGGGVDRRDRIRNKCTRRSLRVANIRDRARDRVMGQSEEDLVRALRGFRVEKKRDRNRPKLTWEQVEQVDGATCGMDRMAVKTAIRPTQPCHRRDKI